MSDRKPRPMNPKALDAFRAFNVAFQALLELAADDAASAAPLVASVRRRADNAHAEVGAALRLALAELEDAPEPDLPGPRTWSAPPSIVTEAN